MCSVKLEEEQEKNPPGKRDLRNAGELQLVDFIAGLLISSIC